MKENKKIPSKEDFVKIYTTQSGNKNAELVYELLKECGEFPEDFCGGSVNSFVDTINSINTYKLLKEIQSNSKTQKFQFWITCSFSCIALVISIISLISVINFW